MVTISADDARDMPESERPAVRALGDARCHLGEGPAYDAASDTAWWFDVLEKALYEAPLSGDGVRRHALPFMASALAFTGDGIQLLVAEDGLYLRDPRDGAIVRHRSWPGPEAGLRSNDARVHPSGTLWFSTMGIGAETGAATIGAYRDGEITTLFSGLTIPNAICFSPDGATGYFSDTERGCLWRLALDAATGLPLGEPAPLLGHGGPGGLDGAVTDAEGTIWCALFGAGAVIAISPTGRILRRLALPANQPSCPVFVGPDFTRMIVTSAYEGMDEAQRAADPGNGLTFVLEAGFRGKAEPPVRLANDA